MGHLAHRSPRRRRRAAWTALAALAVGALTTTPAHAQPTLVQCTGTESVTIDPGATYQAQLLHVTTDGNFGSCLDGQGQVTSASYAEELSFVGDCATLFDPFESTRVFTWNTGDTSTFVGTGSSTVVAGQIVTTVTGTITEGRFAGRSAVQVIALAQLNLLDCLLTGMTNASGATTLTIT